MGIKDFPEYQIYQVAKQRCTNPKSQRWKSHGARGILFLFNSFTEFIEHIGRRPEGDYSLERINNDGNYEPGNVKWATRSEQQLNKRPHVQMVRDGKGYYWHKGAKKWCSRIKYCDATIYLGVFSEEHKAKRAYEIALGIVKEMYEQGVNGTGIGGRVIPSIGSVRCAIRYAEGFEGSVSL